MKLMRKGYWLGTVESFQQAELVAEKRLAPVSLRELQDTKAGLFSGGEDSAVESASDIDVSHMVSVNDGIATIRIAGTLTNDYSPINYYFGEVSYDEIAAAASQLAADPEVKAVILDMDTPGGDANGIERGASALAALGKAKPLYTSTSSMMCSAGYWLGCEGREIWASSLSTVGSIGVVAIHKSYEKAFEKQGVAVTVLRQGQYKMLLNPYEDLTPEAKSMMESQMEIIYGMFLGQVSDKRNIPVATLAEGPGQGQTFLGLQAVKEGLVDQVGDYSKLVNKLRSKYASQSSGSAAGNFNMSERGLSMKIFDRGGKQYVLNAKGQAAVVAGLSEDEAAKNEEFLQEYVASEGGEEQPEGDPAPTGDNEGGEEQPPEGDPAPTDPPQASEGAAIVQMAEKFATVSAEKATLAAQLAKMTEKMEKLEAANAGLSRVAMSTINRFEVALGLSTSKREDYDSDSTIVSKFNRLESDFNGRFKPGAKAEHSNGSHAQVVTDTKGENSPVDKSARSLTSLG